MSRLTVQGRDQRDRAAKGPHRPPRVDHDWSRTPHSSQDAAVMAHIRGAPSVPALVVGIDDLDRRAVHDAADQCRLAGTGKAGHDDHRVVWVGEAHDNSVGPPCEPDVNRT